MPAEFTMFCSQCEQTTVGSGCIAILGQEDPTTCAHIYDVLAKLTNLSLGLDDWVGLALKAGEVNITAMALLDAGNRGSFGRPWPTEVPLSQKAGKVVLDSPVTTFKGHEDLLKQTEGTCISVYTHSEMLPGHTYSELKKCHHLDGHYGTAWQNQKKESDAFPGSILMTTSCI